MSKTEEQRLMNQKPTLQWSDDDLVFATIDGRHSSIRMPGSVDSYVLADSWHRRYKSRDADSLHEHKLQYVEVSRYRVCKYLGVPMPSSVRKTYPLKYLELAKKDTTYGDGARCLHCALANSGSFVNVQDLLKLDADCKNSHIYDHTLSAQRFYDSVVYSGWNVKPAKAQ